MPIAWSKLFAALTTPSARPPLYGEGNAVERICAVARTRAPEPVRA